MLDTETDEQQAKQAPDDALLSEIRERYKYALNAWTDIREQAKIDKRYISGDPWGSADRKVRADAGRPCINHDELNQFVNQAINQVRQSPPAIKIEPAGNGATDKTAELHQGLVRSIEYQSDAQSCYMVAFQSALESSYGWFRVTRGYESDRSFNQNIRIKAILHSDAVLYDPDCKEPDWSDGEYCFVLNPVPKKEFAKKYPKAEKVSFGVEDASMYPDWIQENTILEAEYWRIEKKRATLYQLPDGTTTFDPPKNQGKLKSRTVDRRMVVQYLTNGVEILEKSPQPGTMIPIVAVIGKEMYVDDGGGPERRLFSLVRMARDPQMSLAYLNSLEMEEAGLTPKVPYVGVKGQFESDADTWKEITKVPHAYAQYDLIVDQSGNPLPAPVRQQFTPNFQAYEVAKDSCRRAIQSAMGIMPLPTAAQRNNEKSGIALKNIQQQQSVGSFHFTANLHRALRMAGRIIEEWIPVVYDAERDVAITDDAGKRSIVKLNASQPQPNAQGQLEDHQIGDEDHEVTISVGPSFESTREAAADFIDTLISNIEAIPAAPQAKAQLVALAIKMREMGPLGDQMAEIISPSDQNIPPQAQAAIAKSQQENQALNALLKQLEGEIQQLKMEKAAKVVEQQGQLAKAKLDSETKLAVAEISTKAQILSERISALEELQAQFHDQAHDQAMSAQEHAQTMEQGEQQHSQALEQGQQQNQAAQDQQQQAADISQAQPGEGEGS